jgi:hypothetical protein
VVRASVEELIGKMIDEVVDWENVSWSESMEWGCVWGSCQSHEGIWTVTLVDGGSCRVMCCSTLGRHIRV